MIDADFDASNLGVYLGRYDHPVKFQDVLAGDSEAESAIFRHPTGIKAVVSSNNIDKTEPDTANFKDMIDTAADESDYVIVDGPPGLNDTVETLIAACDEEDFSQFSFVHSLLFRYLFRPGNYVHLYVLYRFSCL